MNDVSVLDLDEDRFAIGQPVPRGEDPVLLRGEGRYTDDINEKGQLYAAMALSRHAHALIRAIDIETAKAMPGVEAVVTGDRDSGYGSTSRMIAESALCLVRDVQGEGGTWTPGALMGPALRKRLKERAGLTFSAR